MSTKANKIIYYAATGLLTVMTLMSVGMYFLNYDYVRDIFINLGYPTYIIYPLATAKFLGLLAIWTKKSKVLKEWAYAGFFFDYLLAISAHVNIKDGEYIPSIVSTILLLISYFYDKKIY